MTLKRESLMRFIISILISIFLGICIAYAEIPFNFSITTSIGFDRATLGSGGAISPTGTHRENWFGVSPTMQFIFNKWEYKPALEICYRREKFDFGDWQAPVQKAEPKIWHALIGLTKDFDFLSTYLLIGITHINYNASLIEAYPYRYHGRNIEIEENLFTGKIGVYKLWKVWKFQTGPAIGLEIFPKAPEVSRCRDVGMLSFYQFSHLWDGEFNIRKEQWLRGRLIRLGEPLNTGQRI